MPQFNEFTTLSACVSPIDWDNTGENVSCLSIHLVTHKSALGINIRQLNYSNIHWGGLQPSENTPQKSLLPWDSVGHGSQELQMSSGNYTWCPTEGSCGFSLNRGWKCERLESNSWLTLQTDINSLYRNQCSKAAAAIWNEQIIVFLPQIKSKECICLHKIYILFDI